MENENCDFNFDDYIVYDNGVDEMAISDDDGFEDKSIKVILNSIKNCGGTIVSTEKNPGLIITSGTEIHGSRSIYDEISSTQFFVTSSQNLTKPFQIDANISSEACNTLQNIIDSVCEEQPIIIESEVLPDGTLALDDPKLTYGAYFTMTNHKTEEGLCKSREAKSTNLQVQSTLPKVNLENSCLPAIQSKNISTKSVKGCDNVGMTLQTSDFPKSHKKLCCKYCHKAVIKLARHLEYVHRDEPDVIKFRQLPKNSKERKDIIATIRKSGTLDWNTDASLNNGLLLTSRRPNQIHQKKATDYTTCKDCLGTYLKTNIRHHRCNRVPLKGERQILVLGRVIEGRIHENACDRLRLKIIHVMHEDDIVRLIRYDWLIILFGNKLCMKHIQTYQDAYIRSQLRQAGRILYTLKNMNSNISDFASIYDSSHYNSIVDTIRAIAGYDSMKNQFGAPKTATTAVTLLRQIGKILRTEYIILKNEDKQKDTQNFLYIMDEDMGISINKAANETQDKRKREKKDNIPTDDDVKIFSEYLNSEMKMSFKNLEENYSFSTWQHLLEVTAASIIVFNRRRVGDTQNILLSEFVGRDSYDEQAPQYATLSNDAKEIAKIYSRMTVRGKKGRTVQVLLKPDVDESIQLLLRHREEAGVSPLNEFLFGLPTSVENKIKVFDACAALRKFSKLCGASNPESLRGTNLRKHIATMCASMKLDDNNIAEVADFMGHSEKIHRDYYRRNPIDRQVVNISKILETGSGKKDSEDDIETENDLSYEEPSIDKRKYESKDKGGEPVSKLRKVRYSEIELQAMKEAFKTYFERKTNPSTAVIEEKREEFVELRGRTVPQIKTWINNKIKGGQPRKKI